MNINTGLLLRLIARIRGGSIMGLFESESKRNKLVVTGTNSYVDIQYGHKFAGLISMK